MALEYKSKVNWQARYKYDIQAVKEIADDNLELVKCEGCGDNLVQEIECLECGHVYPETIDFVQECPVCYNADIGQTVYLTHDRCDEWKS